MKFKAIVADSSPLIIFAKTVGIAALRHVASEILAPAAVISECAALSDKAGADEIRRAIDAGFVSEAAAGDAQLPDSVILLLGRDEKKNAGEKEALALARERCPTVILDDEKARLAARILGLNYVGSSRLLLEAWKAGAFKESVSELLDLWQAHKFFLAKPVRERIEDLARQHDAVK